MSRIILLLLVLCSQRSIAQPISWLTSCSEKNFCLNQGSCTMGAVFLVEKAVTNCGSSNINYSYKIDLNNDGTLDIQSSEDTVSGNFAKGTHKITWKATDNCGLVLQCTYLFHVKDCTPPNLVCLAGLNQSLDAPDCHVAFNPNQFILSTSDNCTPANQIERRIRKLGQGTGFPDSTSVSFGICNQGLNLLEIWIRDGNGLTNSCNTFVIIQDNGTDCLCNIDGDIQFQGCARSANNTRLSSYQAVATITSLPGAATPISKIRTTATIDSCFSVTVPQVPFGNDYKAVVRAQKSDNPLNGVTTFDLVLISKHILGIEPLTSAYQMEAADVNNSNSVTTFDIVETRKLILGIYDTMPNVPAWWFVRPLANPSNLASYTGLVDTYQVNLPNLQNDYNFNGYQFVGIKYGDVNNSAALGGEPDDRSDATPLRLETNDRWINAGEEFTLPFKLGESYRLDGWQLALAVNQNALKFLAVQGLPDGNYTLTDNSLRAIDYSGLGLASPDAIFTLKIKALKSGKLSDFLRLDGQKLHPEAYVPNGGHSMRHPVTFVVKPGANWDALQPEASDNVVSFGISPNPFTTQVDFQVEVKNATPALLEIFDVDGRKIYGETFDLEAGAQSLRVTTHSLPKGNIFFYRSNIAGKEFSGKLVRI